MAAQQCASHTGCGRAHGHHNVHDWRVALCASSPCMDVRQGAPLIPAHACPTTRRLIELFCRLRGCACVLTTPCVPHIENRVVCHVHTRACTLLAHTQCLGAPVQLSGAATRTRTNARVSVMRALPRARRYVLQTEHLSEDALQAKLYTYRLSEQQRIRGCDHFKQCSLRAGRTTMHPRVQPACMVPHA